MCVGVCVVAFLRFRMGMCVMYIDLDDPTAYGSESVFVRIVVLSRFRKLNTLGCDWNSTAVRWQGDCGRDW